MRRPPFAFVVVAAAGLAGCTGFMNHMVVSNTANVLAVAVPAANYESDPKLMAESLPGTIKTVEGFLAGDPGNVTLRRILAQLYGEYAFGFLVDHMEALEQANGSDDQIQSLHDRATDYFLRSFGYGQSIAVQYSDDWKDAVYQSEAAVKQALAQMDGSDDDQVAAVFWMAFGLGQAIDINRDQLWLVNYIPVVHDMFQWVTKADPGFYNGAAWAGLGSIDGARSKSMGGDPDAAKQEFEKAIDVTQGQFLMNKVMMAHVYAYVTQDRKLYVDTLTDVLSTPLDRAPQFRLPNTLAKIRAKRYLAETNDLF